MALRSTSSNAEWATCGALAGIQRRFLVAALLTGIALLAVAPVQAKRIYTYTDENGITHYTDRKPDTEQPVDSRLVTVEPRSRLSLTRVGTNEAPRYRFINEYHGPLELRVSFTEARNIISTPRLPKRFVLPAGSERDLLSFAPANRRRPSSFAIQYEFVFGDPAARHDPDARYLPPIPAGVRALVSQGFNGQATHTTIQSRYAVDIAVEEGTPVHAARDGVVMDVDNDFHGAGTSREFLGRANQVRVLHLDGTMAVYAHLQLESVVVHPGEVVLAGDMLARSGNTGFSSGPHLHFVVQRNRGMALESIPFSFRTRDGESLHPGRGQALEGYRPPLD